MAFRSRHSNIRLVNRSRVPGSGRIAYSNHVSQFANLAAISSSVRSHFDKLTRGILPLCTLGNVVPVPSDYIGHCFFDCRFVYPLVWEYCAAYNIPCSHATIFGGANAENVWLRNVVNLDLGLIKYFIHNCRHSKKLPTSTRCLKFISSNRFAWARVNKQYRRAVSKYQEIHIDRATADGNRAGLSYINRCSPTFDDNG